MKKTKFFLPVVACSLLLSMGLVACNNNQGGEGSKTPSSQQAGSSAAQKEKIVVTAAGDKKTLELNGTVQLTAKVGDAAVEGVTWESSDTAVLTVNNGLVTAVGYGEATISAKKDGYLNGSIGISVPRPAASATFDLTSAAEHYSADGWWELPSSGMFAMQTVNGWNPIAKTQSWMGGDDDTDEFVGGFGVGDKETIKFAASKAEKAELLLNMGNSDAVQLAEVMKVKFNGTEISLAGKSLEEHPGDWGNSLEFDDFSLGSLDLATSNTLEIEFLQATNLFLNELAVFAKEATVTLTNPPAKEQIQVVEEKLEVIVGQTVSIQVKNNLAGVSYVSVDETVATVNNTGVVTGVAQGITNITCKKEGLYSIRVEITVKPAPVAGQILVEAEDAVELKGEEAPSGVMVQRDGGQWSSGVHSGSAYIMIYGASGEIVLTYNFNADKAGQMALSVVGSAPMSMGGDAAVYVFKDSMGIKFNDAVFTPADDAEFPAPEGWSATMSEVELGTVTVKQGPNTLEITLHDAYPSLDVFKFSSVK